MSFRSGYPSSCQLLNGDVFMNVGFLYALSAYVIWGLLPIYLKWLQVVPALQVISHRIVWSFIFLTVFIVLTKQWRRLKATLNIRLIGLYLLAAGLLSVNWLVYVWAVNNGRIVETSLGYFINPLLSIVLGRIFLGERLRALQLIPVILATSGVLYIAYAYGTLPWIALALAGTWGMYGLIKKIATLGSLHGLTMETGFVFLPALGYLIIMQWSEEGQFGHNNVVLVALLMGAGLITIVPLLLFASAVSRISLTMIGMMQYIAPTIQFLIGVFVYHEPFSRDQLIGFALVWIALVIFTFEGFYVYSKVRGRFGHKSWR